MEVEGELEYRGEAKENVRYVKLGSSKFMVSDLCMGTMTMGSYNDEATSHKILDRYVELGGNFIDTAEVYPVPMNPAWMSETEKLIGRWLQKNPDMREKIFLATKNAGPAGDLIRKNRCDVLGQEYVEQDGFLRKFDDEGLRAGLEASLKRLQTNYVDLYQLHWPDRYVPLWGNAEYKEELIGKHQHKPDAARPRINMDDTCKVLKALIEEGKIKAWGVSNETTYGVCSWSEAAKRVGCPGPISIQNDFCLLDRRFETELAEACSRPNHDLGLLCYGALLGGFLTDKYCDTPKDEWKTKLAGARHVKNGTFQRRYHANLDIVKKYQKVAQKYNISLAQLAVTWCRTRFYMGSVIIGATSMAQLEENMSCSNMTLSKECLEELDDIHLERQNPSVGIKFKQQATDSLSQQQKEAAEKKAAEEAAKKQAAESAAKKQVIEAPITTEEAKSEE